MTPRPFPPELLLQIFAFACTDSGITGCSLGLVSRQFRHLVKDTGLDLQSVAVCGVTQMLQFAAMLAQRKRLGEPRHVKHLYISDRELPRFKNYSGHHECGSAFSISKTTLDFSFSFLTYILNLIPSRHLHYLTIDFSTVETFPSIIPVPLPSLRELTVSGPINKLSFRNSHKAPSLQRLHIATHNTLPIDFWRAIAHVAPNVTDLRISSVGKDDSRLVSSLRQFLLRSSSSEESLLDSHSSSSSRLALRSLEKIIIGFTQCCQSSMKGGNPATRYRGVDQQIRAIADEVGSHVRPGRRRIVVREPPMWKLDSQKAGIERSRRRWLWSEWLNGLDGKRGYWLD